MKVDYQSLACLTVFDPEDDLWFDRLSFGQKTELSHILNLVLRVSEEEYEQAIDSFNQKITDCIEVLVANNNKGKGDNILECIRKELSHIMQAALERSAFDGDCQKSTYERAKHGLLPIMNGIREQLLKRKVDVQLFRELDFLLPPWKQKEKPLVVNNFMAKETEWKSDIVKMLDKTFQAVSDKNAKINILSEALSEYEENHTFGQYDAMIIVDEETEVQRKELLRYIRQKLTDLRNTGSDEQPVQSNSNVEKLKWTGKKAQLYDVLRQLKEQGLIGNSKDSLALFFKQCVTGFEDNELSTAEGQVFKKQSKLSRVKLDLGTKE